MAFICPQRILPKNITTSAFNSSLDIFQSSSSGLLMEAQHLWQPDGFFSLSLSNASFKPQEFPLLEDTFPSQTYIFNFVASIMVALLSNCSLIYLARIELLGNSFSPDQRFEVVINRI